MQRQDQDVKVRSGCDCGSRIRMWRQDQDVEEGSGCRGRGRIRIQRQDQDVEVGSGCGMGRQDQKSGRRGWIRMWRQDQDVEVGLGCRGRIRMQRQDQDVEVGSGQWQEEMWSLKKYEFKLIFYILRLDQVPTYLLLMSFKIYLFLMIFQLVLVFRDNIFDCHGQAWAIAWYWVA